MVALVGLHSSISQPPAFARRGLSPNIPIGPHAVAVAVWAFGTLDRGGCDDLREHVRVLQPRVVHVGGLGK